MSTLNVNTVQSSTSNPPIFKNSGGDVAGTLCRAWVSFDPQELPLVIDNSYNISSITDHATGSFEIYFENAMSDNTYCIVGLAGSSTTFVIPNDSGENSASYSAPTANSFYVRLTNASAVANDRRHVYLAVFA